MSAPGGTRESLRRALALFLEQNGCEAPVLDARLLLCAALELDEMALIRAPDEQVGAAQAGRAHELARRRATGEPVSRILGQKEFWGLSFALCEETLDPRPDSETVIAAALRHLPRARGGPLEVLDLGTGTGCLLLALLSELPRAYGVGGDLSPLAARMARDNAARLGLAGRASFFCGCWDAALRGRFDVLLSNPPYIPQADIEGLSRDVRGFDPVCALDGGTDGLDAYHVLFARLRACVAEDGIAVFEFGAGQEDVLTRMAGEAGLSVLERAADMSGRPRALVLSPGG